MSTRLMLVCVAAAAGTAYAQPHSQWTISILHPPGAVSSTAYGVSEGQLVGEASSHATLWTPTGSGINLNPPIASWGSARGVSGGQQVGWVFYSGRSYASLWTGTAASWVNLHAPGGAASSRAYAVQGGQQVGWVTYPQRRASLWTGSSASWIDLNPPGGNWSAAWGVSNGRQVGVVLLDNGLHASLWTGTAASWVDLNPDVASGSVAFGAWENQQVGHARVGGLNRASLWTGTAASWIDLQPPGVTTSTRAYAVYGEEQVGTAAGGAALWRGTPESWTNLGALLPPEFTFSDAFGIWGDVHFTYVVGHGFNDVEGDSQAVLWTRRNCYADCNLDSALNLADFGCYQSKFAAGDEYADCNSDGVRNLADFGCFQTKFALGCG